LLHEGAIFVPIVVPLTIRKLSPLEVQFAKVGIWTNHSVGGIRV